MGGRRGEMTNTEKNYTEYIKHDLGNYMESHVATEFTGYQITPSTGIKRYLCNIWARWEDMNPSWLVQVPSELENSSQHPIL